MLLRSEFEGVVTVTAGDTILDPLSRFRVLHRARVNDPDFGDVVKGQGAGWFDSEISTSNVVGPGDSTLPPIPTFGTRRDVGGLGVDKIHRPDLVGIVPVPSHYQSSSPSSSITTHAMWMTSVGKGHM